MNQKNAIYYYLPGKYIRVINSEPQNTHHGIASCPQKNFYFLLLFKLRFSTIFL